MTSDYATFLASKRRTAPTLGHHVAPGDMHPFLHPWQAEIVAWAVRTGRAAIWADTGLGKTVMSIEYARLSGDTALIVAPLAVCHQTIREAANRLGLTVRYVRDTNDVTGPGLWITNYERVAAFDPALFDVVVLDEASILKNSDGKTRALLISHFAGVPRRLACTATPAPNDTEELTNQAEFVGASTRTNMLATYFVHDQDGWRVKGHARAPMFQWIASWALAVRRPSDLGHPDGGYILPGLDIIPELLPVPIEAEGQLFPTDLGGVGGRAKVRRETLDARCGRAAELVAAEPDEPWLLWCGLNDEADRLTKLIPGAVNVHGALSPEEKADLLLGFADRRVQVLVTKPSLAGLGLNFQHCARMAFVGLSDCYDEQTEVLTRCGWKSFGKVTLDDDLATVHPETQSFEWQAPSRVVWEPYSGPMLHFHGQRNFDLVVTPNHKLYVQRCPDRYSTSDGAWELRYAEDIADRYRRSEYRMLSAPTGGDGGMPDWIDIPAHGRLSTRSRTIERISSEDFVRLAGWYLSEGYCRPLDSAERGRIVICQTEMFPEHRAEIIDLMGRIGLNVNARTKDITGYSVNLAAYLIDQFGAGSYQKRIPRWIKDLHPDLLVILRDTLMKGDGATGGGYYKSVSARLRDDFQEICLRTGIRASVHNDYVSLAWQNTRPAIHRPPETVAYDGMIGCATVPNHTLIVRRNGIPVVSGNSYEAYYQAIRRCYRYGQTRRVRAHVVLSELESQIAANVARKERDAEHTTAALVEQMRRARTETAA